MLSVLSVCVFVCVCVCVGVSVCRCVGVSVGVCVQVCLRKKMKPHFSGLAQPFLPSSVATGFVFGGRLCSGVKDCRCDWISPPTPPTPPVRCGIACRGLFQRYHFVLFTGETFMSSAGAYPCVECTGASLKVGQSCVVLTALSDTVL